MSKDIILAFFGLFLSVVFTQGLFGRILNFIDEFSYSIIPFQYDTDIGAKGEWTKEDIVEINNFEKKRSRLLQRIHKSAFCNSVVAMAMIVAVVTAASFNSVGLPVEPFDTLWYTFLAILFVYSFYIIWSFFLDKKYWAKLPPMAVSRYEMILTIIGFISIFYSVMLYRNQFNGLIFYTFSLIVIFIVTRCYRIPHINFTFRRASDFKERESYYLRDIGKEFFIVTLIFLAISIVHLILFEVVRISYLGEYVNMHPVRVFLILLLIPLCVFLRVFFICVGWRSLVSFLFYFDRSGLKFSSKS